MGEPAVPSRNAMVVSVGTDQPPQIVLRQNGNPVYSCATPAWRVSVNDV